MSVNELLKKDLFGEVWHVSTDRDSAILRDTAPARWWLAWVARGLLRREIRALRALRGVAGVPQLLESDRSSLLRGYLAGMPIYECQPRDALFFRESARLLRRIHRAGVAHNDLAKEPNILMCDDGTPAFVDFQLASYSKNRGQLFRAAAREDIRHLLKHKRTYRPDLLTAREKRILSTPSWPSRAWMALIKPIYLFVTRRLFGWADREGAGDRGRRD